MSVADRSTNRHGRAGLAAVVVSVGLLASSCVLGRGPEDGASELAATAGRAQSATYKATYEFTLERDLAPGVSTTMEITQDPPASVRRLDTSTRSEDDETVTVTSWQARTTEGDFACASFAEDGVRCQANPLARGTFGSEKLDEFFDMPRDESAWQEVRKAARTIRIEGEPATCFEAIPAPEAGAEAVEGNQSVRFELCYAEDGILLRGLKTSVSEGAQMQSEARIEVVSLSRVVSPAELELPGGVVEPGELG